MNIVIRVRNLSISFNKRLILNNIDVDFSQHSISVLIGHSGSGKTTLLRALNRLNEEYPCCKTQGQVYINIDQNFEDIYCIPNKKITSVQKLRQKVGMVFQTPVLLPVSIYNNVAMPLKLVASCPKKEIKSKIEQTLQLVGLWDEVYEHLDTPADQLSGGQQQRLCLARTLALEPSILLLDEPTSSLDIHSTQVIEDLLKTLRAKYTIIMVSHSLEQARRLADQIIVLEKGQVKSELTGTIEIVQIA